MMFETNANALPDLTYLDNEETFLNFNTFSNKDALNACMWALRQVTELSLKPIRIRAVLDGTIVFQHLMDGKSSALWLDRKQKTVELYGHSSLHTLVTAKNNESAFTALRNDPALAPCGGGVPIFIQGTYRGCLCISGLNHLEDHVLAVMALKQIKH